MFSFQLLAVLPHVRLTDLALAVFWIIVINRVSFLLVADQSQFGDNYIVILLLILRVTRYAYSPCNMLRASSCQFLVKIIALPDMGT
ncbi:hypothetical protein PAHAL_1G318100 [Panicum hallii]|jgi:hypothetical protein|uniref:Uncharacterized protein n=1 Tax=Panicum hallii TaxID=206008 RepID=A0A2T8KWZ6_9POAL|nr:hypothetical protein PAHAL_1G318100 [Panicum hallii]